MKVRLLSLCLVLLFALSLVACQTPEQPDGPGGHQGMTYTVSYYYDYDHDGIATGTPDEIDTVPEGNRAVMLSLAPTQQYEIEGWYLLNPDGSTGAKWDVSNPVTENIGLIANWRLRDYNVRYYVGGRELFLDVIPYGTTTEDPYTTSPDLCERVEEWQAELEAGRVFLGWQTADGKLWDFATDTVTYDVTLYALFGEDE